MNKTGLVSTTVVITFANSTECLKGDYASNAPSLNITLTSPSYHDPLISVGISQKRTTEGIILKVVKL